jgi:sugar phosphate isomerase/epimerase
MPHLTMLDATPPEVVAAAAEAGFDAVGLRIFPTMPGERRHPLIGDTPMLRETRSLLAATGLKVLDIEAIWLKPDTDPAAYLSGFEAAGRLGARVVQTIGADPDEARATDNYAALCNLAVPFSLTLDLEYMAFASPNRLDATRRIVRNAGVSNGGLMVDCLHVYRCDTDLDDYLEVDPLLIHELQLCDAAPDAPVGREALSMRPDSLACCRERAGSISMPCGVSCRRMWRSVSRRRSATPVHTCLSSSAPAC